MIKALDWSTIFSTKIVLAHYKVPESRGCKSATLRFVEIQPCIGKCFRTPQTTISTNVITGSVSCWEDPSSITVAQNSAVNVFWLPSRPKGAIVLINKLINLPFQPTLWSESRQPTGEVERARNDSTFPQAIQSQEWEISKTARIYSRETCLDMLYSNIPLRVYP